MRMIHIQECPPHSNDIIGNWISDNTAFPSRKIPVGAASGRELFRFAEPSRKKLAPGTALLPPLPLTTR